MRVLSCFSGIGAHDLGLEWAEFKIVGQIEIDEFCQKVLKKHWPKVPKWPDICSVTATDIRRQCGRVDIITGGFPCQDISTAGKQKGLIEGERSSLWWEMWRLIRELRPDWLLLENVPALRTKGADAVLASLEALGYACWPLVVGAKHVGAPHARKRVWIVGYRSSERRVRRKMAARSEGQYLPNSERAGTSLGDAKSSRRKGGVSSGDETQESRSSNANRNVSNANSSGVRKQSRRGSRKARNDPPFAFPAYWGEEQYEWEEPRTISIEEALESKMGASADGDAGRLVRQYRRVTRQQLKGIGNANPPQIPYLIGMAIKSLAAGKAPEG